MATNLSKPVELTDAELDAVAAGANANAGQVGFINVGGVAAALDLRNIDILSNNDVAANVAVGVLSGIGQRANA